MGVITWALLGGGIYLYKKPNKIPPVAKKIGYYCGRGVELFKESRIVVPQLMEIKELAEIFEKGKNISSEVTKIMYNVRGMMGLSSLATTLYYKPEFKSNQTTQTQSSDSTVNTNKTESVIKQENKPVNPDTKKFEREKVSKTGPTVKTIPVTSNQPEINKSTPPTERIVVRDHTPNIPLNDNLMRKELNPVENQNKAVYDSHFQFYNSTHGASQYSPQTIPIESPSNLANEDIDIALEWYLFSLQKPSDDKRKQRSVAFFDRVGICPVSNLKDNMEDGGNIVVIQSIIDDLRSEDVQIRLKAIKQIKIVAEALGAERTRDELLNFLAQLVGDEDIILEAMAEELGGFINLIGGHDHASAILEPLESLCTAQDSKVREKALKSAEDIAKELSPELVFKIFFPFVQKLATADWFTAHTSAAHLFPAVYPSCPEEQKNELRDLYKKFISNNTPAVRRAASSNLANFITQVENNYIMNDLLPLFKITSTDDQDSVRFLSVDSCIALGNKLSPEEVVEHLLPTVINLLKDSSWRVRYMVADKFVNLSKSLGGEITQTEMVPNFINLLNDTEAVVRTAAASKVTEFSELIPEEMLLNSILPVVSILAADSSQQVRAALASNIMGMAPLLGKEKTISHLLELFLKLLKDVFPEVRLNIISKLEAVNKVIGLELLSQSLLPAIIELAEDTQWRVRLAIINYIPLLANQLGSDFFNEQLINLCMSWLGDPIFSIRDASINNLKRLVEIFGVSWGDANIFPRIINLYNSETYLSRMTSLFSVHSLVPIVGPEVLNNSFLPLLIKMAADPVPNIRFNVAQTLQLVSTHVDADSVNNNIKPILTTLLEDNDTDVKYYAFMALHAIGS